jgi:cell division septation protein DedD
MSEQHFREIQLSGKQLVFLFMTSVVVAVGVFLLGVSVGRGVPVNSTGAMEDVDQTTALVLPGEMPEPTELTPADTGFHDNLLGTTTPPAEPEPVSEPVAEEPAEETAAPAPPAPRVPPAAAPSTPTTTPPTTAPPSPATQKPVASRPAPAVTDGWFVQIGAYRSRQNADRQARELVAKGYAAAVSPSGAYFRVRVGPFAQKPEADRISARLKSEEGTESSVTR